MQESLHCIKYDNQRGEVACWKRTNEILLHIVVARRRLNLGLDEGGEKLRPEQWRGSRFPSCAPTPVQEPVQLGGLGVGSVGPSLSEKLCQHSRPSSLIRAQWFVGPSTHVKRNTRRKGATRRCFPDVRQVDQGRDPRKTHQPSASAAERSMRGISCPR